MAIKGSLKEASLPDVLQLLAMGTKTGCLSVTDRSSFGYIYFDQGRIVYSSLLNRRDRLGDILVREEVVTREQLESAIQQQSESRDGRRLGEILQDSGFLDQETLNRYVQHQIEEAVYHLFTWSQGTFYFEPGQRPENETILVSIDPESLLLEGARRVDEWSQIAKKIPSLDLIFVLDADRSSSLSSLNLTPEQEKVLPLLDGKHSVWDVIDETALPEFDVGKALYGLVSAGFVRRAGERDRGSRSEKRKRISEHRNLGVAFYKTSMFDEAIRELKVVLEAEKEAADAEFFLGLIACRQGDLASAEKRFRAIIERGVEAGAAYNNLAEVLVSQGRIEEAVEVLDKGLAAEKPHPQLLLAKAQLQLSSGDPAGAKGTLVMYRDQVGDAGYPPLYYSTMALTDAMTDDLKSAAKLVEEGVARHPTSGALANNAGVIFERKGDFLRALEMYRHAFEEESELPQASKNIGDLLYRDGEYEEAAEAYERSLVADPDLGDDVYAKLGNVYYKRRERQRAIDMWQRALELNPDNEVVRTNLEFVRGSGSENG